MADIKGTVTITPYHIVLSNFSCTEQEALEWAEQIIDAVFAGKGVKVYSSGNPEGTDKVDYTRGIKK